MESVIALALSLGHCSADDELRLAAQTAAELVPDACHVRWSSRPSCVASMPACPIPYGV